MTDTIQKLVNLEHALDSIDMLKKLWCERITIIEREAIKTEDPVTLARLQGRVDELKKCIETLG